MRKASPRTALPSPSTRAETRSRFATRASGSPILDRDVDELVRLLGGDLTKPHQFIRVAEAMGELELDDEVLAWAVRGIAQTSGWQVGRLYDLACGVHARRDEPLEVLALRRAQHERMPSSSTYRGLRSAADAVDAWAIEQDAARATLQRADLRGFVEVLLDDGDVELAWSAAASAPRDALGADLWMRLAEAREPESPGRRARGLSAGCRRGARACRSERVSAAAARILLRARAAAEAAGQLDEFDAYLARVREQYRRRPTLIAILDKAKLR